MYKCHGVRRTFPIALSIIALCSIGSTQHVHAGAAETNETHDNEGAPASADRFEAGDTHYGPQPGRLEGMPPPGWAATVRLPDGKRVRIASTGEGLNPNVALDENGRDTVVVWDGLGAGPLAQLTVRMVRRKHPSGAAWRLDIENRGEAAVWNVTFPDLQFPVTDDDKVVIPSVSGRLHRAKRDLALRRTYPSGLLSMQCSGFYGPSGGVYVAAHDPRGSIKELEMNVKRGRLAIRWHWPVPNMGVPGTGWGMPGEVVVRPFEGDWFDLAHIYREWARKEAGWWPRGAQTGRPDTPDWFKDISVWVMSNGPWPWRRDPIPMDEAVAKAKRFAEYMDDIPVAVHWYNWHQIPFDDRYPEYFPAKEGFAEGIQALQAAGVRVMPYINAHLWDTKLPDFKTIARPAAVKSYDASLPTKRYSGNTFAPMCPATPLWRETVKDLVLKLAGPDYGVDGVYLDQISSVSSMLCFDEDHAHPIGGGDWWLTQGNWPMLESIRQSSPETILTSECAAEPYVNRVDGYLTWLGYRDADDAIPLFHAVYGGQVQLFGQLYKWDSWKGVAMRAKTAQSLVWGEQLGWIAPKVIDDPVAAPFLKRLARLRFELRRYVSRGRMARPPAIITDGSQVTANWVATRDLIVTTPTVLSGAWHRDDGEAVVLILVNVDDQPRSVTVPFDADTYHLDGDLLMREWTGTEDGKTPPRVKPTTPSWERKVDLAPMASLAIEIAASEDAFQE